MSTRVGKHQREAHHVPGRPPDSANPSSMRSSTKLTGPRTRAMQEAATPHVMLMKASQAGPPNLLGSQKQKGYSQSWSGTKAASALLCGQPWQVHNSMLTPTLEQGTNWTQHYASSLQQSHCQQGIN